MTKIFLAAFQNGPQIVFGYAMTENGVVLATHLSSSIEWSKHDLGLTSDWKHHIYSEACPDGYELVWIDEPHKDPRWKDAIALNHGKTAEQNG